MANRRCSVEGCTNTNRVSRLRGMCSLHYQRWRKWGDPLFTQVPRHGYTDTRTWRSWRGMLNRCTLPNLDHYKDYGGRGITVCDRWRVFPNFLADMGERPAGTTLDRVNNEGNYEPGNCRWSTPQEQAANRRARIKTTCANGHVWVAENIYTRPNGTNICRICNRELQRVRYAKKREGLRL